MSERDEWVPSFYDGYETCWSDEDQCYIARCAPEYGLLAFVTTYGDTREQAVQKLVEILPEVACMNHSTHDEWVQRARKAEAELARLRAPVDPPEIEDVLHGAGYVTADIPIPETSDSARCRECGRKTETVSGVCIRCAVKSAPFVDPPERGSEQEWNWANVNSWLAAHGYEKRPLGGWGDAAIARVSEASANEYRPWEAMGITELAYWKRRYIEARMSEASALREALEEIARLGCEDWPGGHVLTCSCNSCIARRALEGAKGEGDED